MKVLHVIPSVSERSGGPGQAIVPMCLALREQGVDVLLATTDHGMVSSPNNQVSSSEFQAPSPLACDAPESSTRNSKLETRNSDPETRNLKLETRNYKGVPTIFFPVQWGDSFKYSRPFAKWLDANVENFDLVHIHAVFNHACIAAAGACRDRRVPYIVRPLGTLDPWSMKQKPLRKALFWNVVGKRVLRGAAVVHYTAQAEQQAAEQSLGLNHGKVVPLGVEIPNEAALDDESLSDAFLGLAGHPYVLVLSRLQPNKGLDVLLDAFLPLANTDEFREWRLVLAGEGPAGYVDSLKGTVAAQCAEEFVVFPGWLDGEKKQAALRHAALLALPSFHENFGLCVMESLACGVPVLVSPHVNLAPEIEAAGAGWIANVDAQSLEQTLAAALSSEGERERRGANGRVLAENYTWLRIAAQLVQLYERVAAD